MMRYRIEPMEGYLRVAAEGPFDAQMAKGIVGEIGRACAAHGLGRVLIDARGLEGIVGVAERFQIARTLAEDGTGRMRIAILVDESQLVSKALEDTAINRGAQLCTTAIVDEAYGFLGLAAPA